MGEFEGEQSEPDFRHCLGAILRREEKITHDQPRSHPNPKFSPDFIPCRLEVYENQMGAADGIIDICADLRDEFQELAEEIQNSQVQEAA
jgi:hypothetical protein